MKLSLLTALALLAMPAIANAAPFQDPDEYCEARAEVAYQQAVALGDGLPDGIALRTAEQCRQEFYRDWLFTTPAVSLNELIRFDQEADFEAARDGLVSFEREETDPEF